MFLHNAHICINCEWIGDSATTCIKCGGSQTMPLAQWFRSITEQYLTWDRVRKNSNYRSSD
jgi:hypothetical protein